jgi:hypothetical protein
MSHLHFFAIVQGLLAVLLLGIPFVAMLSAAIFLRTVVLRMLGFADEEDEDPA